MKKVNTIEVLISLNDIINVLDSKNCTSTIADVIEICKGRVEINEIILANSIVRSKVAKIGFYYEKHLPKPKYIPYSSINLWEIVRASTISGMAQQPNVEIYDTIEEAKIHAMLDGAKNLFEMPTRAVKLLKFYHREDKWAAITLWCHMSFSQVNSLLKRV